MKGSRVRSFWIPCVTLAALIGTLLLVAARNNRPMLFQHGTPEVPQNHAFAIMNPFRNRGPEEVAEVLMSDLRTSRCEQILRDLHSEDSRICSAMSQSKSSHLIWREDRSTTRVLVYDLPGSKSRLWITWRRDEVGFVVNGISLIR
jgi:hypothetical protein